MKLINFTCSHGLNPGPWIDWESHKSEHDWLLNDICKNLIKASHIIIPTESVSRNNQFEYAKLAWFCNRVRQFGMVPVIWIDKWLWIQDFATIKSFLQGLIDCTIESNPIMNLSNELDLLWVKNPSINKFYVLENLSKGRFYLYSRGIKVGDIMAGGATVDGTIAIGDAISPGILTWTAWDAIQRGLSNPSFPSGSTVYNTVKLDLDKILDLVYNQSRLMMIETGWSVRNTQSLNLPGDLIQEKVYQQSIRAAKECNVEYGIWTNIDWIHDQVNQFESSYGILGYDPSNGLYVRQSVNALL